VRLEGLGQLKIPMTSLNKISYAVRKRSEFLRSMLLDHNTASKDHFWTHSALGFGWCSLLICPYGGSRVLQTPPKVPTKNQGETTKQTPGGGFSYTEATERPATTEVHEIQLGMAWVQGRHVK
jgi:hypothetical protein